MSNAQTPPIIIWRLTDGKIGHEKQSQAFIEALSNEREIKVVEAKVTYHALYYIFRWLCKLPIFPDNCSKLTQKPDLVIGTGHKTHIPVLLTQRQQRCKSIVIMSPSLPARFFDAIVAPEHDYINKKKPPNVVTTLTALAPAIDSRPNSAHGLILLGGESKHFYWNSDEVAQKVKNILSSHPKEIIWQLSDSRRTPSDTLSFIRNECKVHKNINILHHEDIGKDWLKNQLLTAGNIWVTADSASMLAEAMNTKANIGLISLTPKKDNCKINVTNNNLVHLGYLKKDNKEKTFNSQQRPRLTDVIKKSLSLLEL